MTRRLLVAATTAVLFILVTAGPASAHAVLEATSPADGAHVPQPPTLVSLTFNENISASLGAVRVFNGQGNRVDDGNVVTRNHTVTVGLQKIGDGGYIVTWRVISADSHPVRGAFTFTVGTGAAASSGLVSSLLNSGSDTKWDVAGDIARGFMYGGTLLAAGGAIFLALAHDGRDDRRVLARVVLCASIVGAVGLLVTLPIAAALATGLGLGAITHNGVLSQVLGDGIAAQTITVLVGLIVATVAVMWSKRTTATRVAAVVGGAAAAIGFAFAGHTTITSPRALVYTADIVHVLAAAVWFGGLVFLALFLMGRRKAQEDAVGAGGVVARFSRMATYAIILLGIAGGILAYEQVKAIHALTSTTYGRLVLVKIGLVVVIACVATYNHYRLVPALQRAEERGRNAWSYLLRTVRFEILGLIIVIGVTGVLVNEIPARTAAGIGVIYSQTQPLGNDTVNLVVDPNRAGPNAVHLYILDATGRPAPVPNGVTLEMSLPAKDLGPLTEQPFLAGPGHYQLNTNDLSFPGKWTIVVRAQFSKFEESTASFDVNVNP